MSDAAQRRCLPLRQAVPDADAGRFHAFHAADSLGQFRCASNPLSAASAASLRIADILIMMDDDPSRRSSSDTRHALTVAFVKPGRGACWNQAMNSFRAIL
jgi:hypothetical protein